MKYNCYFNSYQRERERERERERAGGEQIIRLIDTCISAQYDMIKSLVLVLVDQIMLR